MPFDLTTWMLVFLRASAMLTIFPLFSMQNFPVQLRIALGTLLSFLVAPTLPPAIGIPSSFVGLIMAMVAEVGIGLLLGFMCRLVFHVLEFAGNLISTEMGLNMASTLNPFTHGRSDVPGMVLYYLGAVLFLVLDLHHALLLAFQRAYAFLPIGGAHLKDALFTNVVGSTSHLFLAGLLMAAPVIAVSFLVNLVFSVLGRAVPQMNVFSESFAFRIFAGLAVFGLSLSLMAQHIVNYMRRLPDDVIRVAQLLGSA
jgi:flagellar biosynthetic protein FliR